jgi:hypothetical protein
VQNDDPGHVTGDGALDLVGIRHVASGDPLDEQFRAAW